jgi:two-component system nitrogen regulation sensor histidine kinase NtrY
VLFNSVLSSLARSNGLSEAVVFDGSGRILARSSFSLAVAFERVPPEALEKAGKGQIALLNSEYEDRMRALVKLGGFLDSYLYVGKFVDPEVIDHLNKTYAAVAQYRQAEEQQTQIEVAFAALFTGVAMLVLLAAVWYGLNISNRLVRPISSMVTAAERVRQGDLSARVPEEEIDDEISTLNRTFNRMTGQLETQRRELIETNRQLDDRRRFTETVLAGVSAGVVGIDLDGRITLHNPSASSLLGISPDRMVGSQFAEAIPEMAELFKLAHVSERPAQGQVNLVRAGQVRNLMVRVSRETASEATLGFIVTFDDITDLVSAQRTAAWADVARRIAHEIKNPLTPIQLSAERLRRKYTHEIVTDPEVFNRCTDTIIRQVNDIGRMVDEFSSFARLPTPRFSDENAADLVRQALFLQHVAHTDIDFVSALPAHDLKLRCDSRQIAQVLTNVLLNAAQSINGREGKSDGLSRGRIVIQGHASAEGGVILEVIDNGRGLPSENRARLAEPYVTTRTKGTGLGLAIVKKIMEEHSGRLEMDDAPGGGAVVRLVFPDLHTLPLSENRPESGQPAKAAV